MTRGEGRIGPAGLETAPTEGCALAALAVVADAIADAVVAARRAGSSSSSSRCWRGFFEHPIEIANIETNTHPALRCHPRTMGGW